MNSAGLAPSDPTTPSERRAAEAAESYPPDLPTQPDRRSTVPVEQPLPPVDEALAASAEPGPILASGATADVFALDDQHGPAPLPLRPDADPRGRTCCGTSSRTASPPRPCSRPADRTSSWSACTARPCCRRSAPRRSRCPTRPAILPTCTPGCTRSPRPRAGGRASPTPGRWSPSGPVVVHLDLHPANVILDRGARPGPGRLVERPHRDRRARRRADRADHRRGRGRRRRRLLAGRPRAARGVPARDRRRPARRARRRRRAAVRRPVAGPRREALVPAAAVLVRDLIAVATPSA